MRLKFLWGIGIYRPYRISFQIRWFKKSYFTYSSRNHLLYAFEMAYRMDRQGHLGLDVVHLSRKTPPESPSPLTFTAWRLHLISSLATPNKLSSSFCRFLSKLWPRYSTTRLPTSSPHSTLSRKSNYDFFLATCSLFHPSRAFTLLSIPLLWNHTSLSVRAIFSQSTDLGNAFRSALCHKANANMLHKLQCKRNEILFA